LWQKIHIDYRSNSYHDIAISCDPETEREGKWERGRLGGSKIELSDFDSGAGIVYATAQQ